MRVSAADRLADPGAQQLARHPVVQHHAALGVEVWVPAAIIGVTACMATLIGTIGGRALGARFGSRMAVVGGFVLIAIGVWIVVEHVVRT